MALIALISCTKSKKPYRCKASEMYSESRWFPKAHEYVKRIGADKVFILSALYGLVPENKEIDYYQKTLNDCSDDERKEWAQRVLSDLKCEADLERDSFIIIAGKNYYEYLIPFINNVNLPLVGLNILKWESTLNKMLRRVSLGSMDEYTINKDTFVDEEQVNYSYEIHKLMNKLPRIKYPFSPSQLPDNGIYVMFEEGEKHKDLDRIVRVGTHNSPNRLKGRLRDHYINENKDGSIFRKNIGRAILNMSNDSYLSVWEYDLSRTNNEEILQLADEEYQAIIERKVSNYIRNNISFVVIGEIIDKDERLRLEAAIIATLNNDKEFAYSANWLGTFSPKEEIKNSGLWLVEGLADKPLTYDEFKRIEQLVKIDNYSQVNKAKEIQHTAKESNSSNEGIFSKVLIDILEEARAAGKEFIDVESGVIHRIVGGYPGKNHKMPLCCKVMRSFMKTKDIILYSPPSGNGAKLHIRYYLR